MEDWNEKLITATRTGDSGALKLCLQNDADIDYQGVRGWTALMWAARRGHLEICKLLIDTGCKIDTTDVDGWTALMLAAMYGHLEICRLLIDTGCKIDTTNGKTPYDVAAAVKLGQYREVMEYLQSVMSEKSSGVTAGQGMEGNFH
ncbi:unnamed protein product [Mytilus coruscus]|uniref:Uncharacterized protein n=1 Tax=Mytilus coruscus TaxID=42192 RepID=A0A6J8CHX9_MYTCO|nr:unnamed protein product [Mytilus coruscus]